MSSKIFVTVSGVDKVGIVAKVTAILAQCEVNIEDIKQTLMQGHFVMFMLCDIEKSTYWGYPQTKSWKIITGSAEERSISEKK